MVLYAQFSQGTCVCGGTDYVLVEMEALKLR